MSNANPVYVENLVKRFGPHAAVADVSFQIRPGECYGLLGPNGAGKSTLINMIYGVLPPSAGTLRVFGLDPERHGSEVRRRLGVVTQDNALDESLSVHENMDLYAAFQGVPRARRRARVDELLEFMNLAHKRDAPIRALSGGMKRRLVFVRALLANPELVILDEPTTGLDPAVRHLLWGKVNELKREGKTVLLTTHYMHEAEVLCDRLVVMTQGRIVREGTPAGLRHEVAPGFVAVYDADEHGPLIADARARTYDVHVDSSGAYVRAPDMGDLMQLGERHARSPRLLRPSNLEDVFLKLTGQELTADA